MRPYPLLTLCFFALTAIAFGQPTTGSIAIQDSGGGQFLAARVIGTESHELVEFSNGDPAVHYRPGNHKPGKMTVTKDWTNTPEFFRTIVQDCLNGGMLARKSISVIFHNDAGSEVGREDFAMFGDTDVEFPATGLYATDRDGISVSFTSYLHSNNIVHRDLATRNFLRTKGFIVTISEAGAKERILPADGTSSLSVHVATDDLDGDGIPDVVARISASHTLLSVPISELPAVQKWSDQTDAAAAAGVPCTRHLSYAWTCRDGSTERVDFDATLVSASPQWGGGIELECAVENVKFS